MKKAEQIMKRLDKGKRKKVKNKGANGDAEDINIDKGNL